MSIMVPLVALALHFQIQLVGNTPVSYIPTPSLRINLASVVSTLIDLVFLAVAWEYLGKPGLKMKLWIRAFLTLLGVMWIDVFLFATCAFAGTPEYLNIMKGTLISRFIIASFALPFLYGYLHWQSEKKGIPIENRAVLAILKQVAEIEVKLSLAHQEIERRKKAEKERDTVINKLETALSEIKTLRGFLPICSYCNCIRNDQGQWDTLEAYVQEHSEAQFSHSICPKCANIHYPELDLYSS